MNDLINTSLNDACSSLKCAEDNGHLNIADLDANILALQALAGSGHAQPIKLRILVAKRKRWIKLRMAQLAATPGIRGPRKPGI